MSVPDTAVAARHTTVPFVRAAVPADHPAIRDVVIAAYRQYAELVAWDVFFPYLVDVLDLERPARHGRSGIAPIMSFAYLRHLTPEERKGWFVYGYSQQRFSEPFYFGRIRHMVLAFFFDNSDNIRFTISPVGGGVSILPGRSCPAWDWLWLIPHARAGRTYTLRVRMLYKPFRGEEDILAEFTRWRG